MRWFSANLNDVWIAWLQAIAARNPLLSEPCMCLPFRLPNPSQIHDAAWDAYKQGAIPLDVVVKTRLAASKWTKKIETKRKIQEKSHSYFFALLTMATHEDVIWNWGPKLSAKCCPPCLLLVASILFNKIWVIRAFAIQEKFFLKRAKADIYGGDGWKETLAHSAVTT